MHNFTNFVKNLNNIVELRKYLCYDLGDYHAVSKILVII